MRHALLVIVVAMVAACSSDDAPAADAAVAGRHRCEALEGVQFASLTEGECGLGSNGPALCTWHITFSANDATTSAFTWQHSDAGQDGTVTCDGNTVEDPVTFAHRGTYDPASRQLVWEGVTYAAP